jgi:hypothetical protein
MHGFGNAPTDILVSWAAVGPQTASFGYAFGRSLGPRLLLGISTSDLLGAYPATDCRVGFPVPSCGARFYVWSASLAENAEMSQYSARAT